MAVNLSSTRHFSPDRDNLDWSSVQVLQLQSVKMKWSSLISACLGFAATTQAATAWQQRNETFAVADAPLGIFPNFTSKADAVASLELKLNASKISRQGDFRYGQTIARIWTEQRKIWPELILYPENTVDVSVIMQFYSAAHTFWGDNGFAISTYSPPIISRSITSIPNLYLCWYGG